MRIRPFLDRDVEVLVALARINVRESRFSVLPFDEEKVRMAVKKMVHSPQSRNFHVLAESTNGQIVGYLVGMIEEYFFCYEKVAMSVFFFVAPDKRGGLAAMKMVLAFRAWAKARQATELYIGVASGVLMERTGRFLQRVGLTLTGGNYSMWLRQVNNE